MKLYSYVITRDYGFAPNPYHGFCTLATCKPRIRRVAKVGDWVAGFGGSGTSVPKKLVYIMQVSEKITFEDYWNDERFFDKRPFFMGSRKMSYGDNIYDHDIETDSWIQHNSHHSLVDGFTNYENLNRDTSANAVLISNTFWYFGRNACNIPSEYQSFVARARNHNTFKVEEDIVAFITWLNSICCKGIYGIPFSLTNKREFVRFSG
jgi:hypothetical protein